MGFWSEGWTWRQRITAQPGVIGEVGAIPFVVTADNLDRDPSTGFWPQIASDGADLRVALDADGDMPVAFDLAEFDYVSGRFVLWIKADAITGQNYVAWIFAGNPAALPIPVADPLGRNAVWSDYSAVYGGSSIDDRTGNGHDLTDPVAYLGQPEISADGPLGSAYETHDRYLPTEAINTAFASPPGSSILGQTTGATIECFVNLTQPTVQIAAGRAVFAQDVAIGQYSRGWFIVNCGTNTCASGLGIEFRIIPATDNTSGTISVIAPLAEAGRWYKLHAVFDASSRLALYVDGVLAVETTTSVPGQIGGSTAPVSIGAFYRFDPDADAVCRSGLAAQCSAINAVKSDDQIALEAANQTDPAGFWLSSPSEQWRPSVFAAAAQYYFNHHIARCA